MSKFKVGDRVKIVDSSCGLGKVGERVTISNVNSATNLYQATSSNASCWKDSHLELVPNDLDHLKVGDTLVRQDEERNVLAVVGTLIAFSKPVSQCGKEFAYWGTIHDLKTWNYKVKDAEEELIELTLEDVAKKMGVPVDKIRIKDGE